MGLVKTIIISLRKDINTFQFFGFSYQYYSLLSYLMLFSFTFLYFSLFLNVEQFQGFDPDNVRYTLSALIQSLAAIITLTVSLSIVAAQLMSSSYSIRIIEIYRKNPDVWIILVVYLVVIVLDVYVLNFFNYNSLVLSNDNLLFGLSSEKCVGLCFFLSIFALLSLIPYLYNTISILRPNKIIKILGGEIKTFKLDRHKNQPLQILHDFLISGISKYDISLVYSVLDELDDAFSRILRLITDSGKTKKEKNEEIDQLTSNYREFITRIYKYAFDQKMEYAIAGLILSMEHVVEKVSPLHFESDQIIFNLISSMTTIIIRLLNDGFDFILGIYNDIFDDQLIHFQASYRTESLKDSIIASIKIYSEYEPEPPYYLYFEQYLHSLDTLLVKKFEQGNVELIDYIVLELSNLLAIYSRKGLKEPVNKILTSYYAIFNKCDDDRYNSVIKNMMAIDLECGFIVSSDHSEIKELFLTHLHILLKDKPELFDEELTEFKKYLKEKNPGILADVREVFPDD